MRERPLEDIKGRVSVHSPEYLMYLIQVPHVYKKVLENILDKLK